MLLILATSALLICRAQLAQIPACGGGEANAFYSGEDVFTSTDSCDTCANSCAKAGGRAWDYFSSRPTPCHCKAAGFVKQSVAGHVGGVSPPPSPPPIPPTPACGGGEANTFYNGNDVFTSTDSCDTCARSCANARGAAWDYVPSRLKPCHCKAAGFVKQSVVGHVGGVCPPPSPPPSPPPLPPTPACGGGEANTFYTGNDVFTSTDSCDTCARSCANAGGAAWDYVPSRSKPCHCKAAGTVKQSVVGHVGGVCQAPPTPACGGGDVNVFYVGTDVFTSTDSCSTCASTCGKAGGAAWDFLLARSKPCHCKADGFIKTTVAGHVGGVLQPSPAPAPACGGGEANTFYSGADVLLSTDSCNTCANSCAKAGAAAWDYFPSRAKPCHCKSEDYSKGAVAGHVGGALKPPRVPWPTFANAADLSVSPWGTYFKSIYGSLPSAYPLAVADFWTIDDAVAVANGVLLPPMQTCPATFSLDGTPYSINNLYQPDGVSWIWHSPPFSAFKSHEWVEVMHEADPWGDEQHGAWMVYAKGSGIWYNLGNTIAFQEHNDAMAKFGSSDNPTMSQKGLAAGYDSLQFLAHDDPVQYPCDINHHPETRYAAPKYLNIEFVCTACVGTFACMGSSGAPSSVRAGWLGSSPCGCSNGEKNLNCNGFGANASFRNSSDKFLI